MKVKGIEEGSQTGNQDNNDIRTLVWKGRDVKSLDAKTLKGLIQSYLSKKVSDAVLTELVKVILVVATLFKTDAIDQLLQQCHPIFRGILTLQERKAIQMLRNDDYLQFLIPQRPQYRLQGDRFVHPDGSTIEIRLIDGEWHFEGEDLVEEIDLTHNYFLYTHC